MQTDLFFEILRDKHFPDYETLRHKYGADFDAFLRTLEQVAYVPLPIADRGGNKMVFLDRCASVRQQTVKLLLQTRTQRYGLQAAEDEIVATSAIESVDVSRDSVRNILKGMAPQDEQENRILGVKHGLDFIADRRNAITEENLYRLYQMTIGSFLPERDRLQAGRYYRHDAVYVVSDRVEHAGADWRSVPDRMRAMIAFAQADDGMDDLVKAAILHFYLSYIHPYFDGNGRMARLLHLWFLVQKGYRSALFIPFSDQIEKSRRAYYAAFTTVEQNRRYSGRTDVTPFILYCIRHIYDLMQDASVSVETDTVFADAVRDGQVTDKQAKLWSFVLSVYGAAPFSTKQLEKDFGDAAYATIRSFVLHFEELGLLTSVRYGTRVRYQAAQK